MTNLLRPVPGVISAYFAVAALMAIALTPVGPVSMEAAALRVQDTGLLLGQPVQSFQAQIPLGATSSNSTLYVPLNASAYIVDASVNLSGRFGNIFSNLSGRGLAAEDQFRY